MTPENVVSTRVVVRSWRKQARTPDMRQTFLHLSDTWIRLAAELESAQAFLNAVNGLEIKTPIAGDLSLPVDADSPPSE